MKTALGPDFIDACGRSQTHDPLIKRLLVDCELHSSHGAFSVVGCSARQRTDRRLARRTSTTHPATGLRRRPRPNCRATAVGGRRAPSACSPPSRSSRLLLPPVGSSGKHGACEVGSCSVNAAMHIGVSRLRAAPVNHELSLVVTAHGDAGCRLSSGLQRKGSSKSVNPP